jgi:hypothetical protein
LLLLTCKFYSCEVLPRLPYYLLPLGYYQSLTILVESQSRVTSHKSQNHHSVAIITIINYVLCAKPVVKYSSTFSLAKILKKHGSTNSRMPSPPTTHREYQPNTINQLFLRIILTCRTKNHPLPEHLNEPNHIQLIEEQHVIGWDQVLKERWSREWVRHFEAQHPEKGENAAKKILTTF